MVEEKMSEITIINGKTTEEPPLSEAEKNTILIRYTTREILTDIRDYLVKRQKCLAIESRMCSKIRETALVLSMIEDLQKYAEKLGVEL